MNRNQQRVGAFYVQPDRLSPFQDQITLLREHGLLADPIKSEYDENTAETYFDFERLDSGDLSKQEIYAMEEWLENGSTLSQDLWPSSEPNGFIFEKLAFYQPITFYHEAAGIFITTKGVQLYGGRYLRALRKLPLSQSERITLAVKSAIKQLLLHEIFHHYVEWMALKFDITFGQGPSPRYQEYFEHAYRDAMTGHLGSIEEALASAYEFRGFPRKPQSKLPFPDESLAVIRNEIFESFSSRPIGYRDAPMYLSDHSFKLGVGQLLNSLEGSSPKRINMGIGPQLEIQKGQLEKYFLKNWTLVESFNGSSPAGMPFTFSVPDRSLKRLLSEEGYKPTSMGKGSHEVWKREGRPNIVVPYRKDQEGIKFLKSVAASLGYKGIRELVHKANSI